jgi:hypothetical protein
MADIATLAPGRSRFGLSLPLLLTLLVYGQILVFGGAVLGDPDTYWHIAVGRWIIAHAAVPHRGIFSFTMAEAPWVAHEWLGEVVLAWLFDHFGWAGLVAATGFCIAAALAMLLRVLLRTLAPVHALIAAVLAWMLALPHVIARPHIFAMPILVAWVAGLVAARREERAPSPWLAPLMLLWANLHGGYMFGLVLAALFAGEAVFTAADWRAGLRAARGWGLFGGMAVAAALITPFGIDGLLLPFKQTQMSFALAVLEEWQSPNFQRLTMLEVWLMLLFLAALSLGWRLPLSRVGMLLLLVHMALQHRRYGELLGFVAPLLLAPALAPQLAARAAGHTGSMLDRSIEAMAKPARAGGIALAGAVLLALTAAVLHGRAPYQPASRMTPIAALAAVSAQNVEGPVFNEYGFGGYLIFSGIEPFIDGRAELYGDAFIKRYLDAISAFSDQLMVLLNEYGIAWTLISPQSPGVALLDHLPGWRRLYADDIAVVHVREGRAAR